MKRRDKRIEEKFLSVLLSPNNKARLTCHLSFHFNSEVSCSLLDGGEVITWEGERMSIVMEAKGDMRDKRLRLLRALFASPNVQGADLFYHDTGHAKSRKHFCEFFMELMEKISSSQTLRFLEIHVHRTTLTFWPKVEMDKAMRALSHMLRTNSSLHRLQLWRVKIISPAQATYFAEALAKNRTLQKLALYNCTLEEGALKELLKPLMGDAHGHQSNTSLTSLLVNNCGIGPEGVAAMAGMLSHNNTLSTLQVSHDYSFKYGSTIDLLNSLKNNVALNELDLSGCAGVGGNEVLAVLLDLLEVNINLQTIGLHGTELHMKGSSAMVLARLKTKSEKIKNVKLINTVTQTSAKVFLCGDPCAGKTTYRKAFIQHSREAAQWGGQFLAHGYNSLLRRFPFKNKPPLRTTGIKVEVVAEKDLQIQFWDLGGREFHAFHDLVLPNVSDRGSACTFMLFCKIVGNNFAYNLKDMKVLEVELEYWLRYISSSTRLSRINMIPRVTVVFTHVDKFPGCPSSVDVQDIMARLRTKYEDLVHISDDVFFVDARSSVSIKDSYKFVTQHIRNLLENAPKVPAAYNEVEHALADWNRQYPDRPLLSRDEYTNLLSRIAIKEGLDLSNQIGDAVTMALHESGKIFSFNTLDVVVVDTNWFCHDIVGPIFNMDKDCGNVHGGLQFTDDNGHASWKKMELLIQKYVLSEGSASDLIQVMIKLNLCFQVQDTKLGVEGSYLFIPAALRDPKGEVHRGERKLSWKSGPSVHGQVIFLGRRMECEDRDRTFLSPGFFPRLQVVFQKRSDINHFRLEKDFLAFTLDGLEVLVEYGGQSCCHIDILVRSSNDYDTALKIIREEVMTPIRELCASTGGCQGVILVEAILRPECVKGLWLCKNRKNQAIWVEKLKEAVFLRGNLEYKHGWGEGENGAKITFDKASTLLGKFQWEDVVRRYLHGLASLGNNLEQVGDQQPSSSELQTKGFLDFKCADDDTPQHKQVMAAFASIDKKIAKGFDESFAMQERIVKMTDQALMMQQRLIPELSQGLDRVVDFSLRLQQRQVPRLVYFTTKDNTIGQRLMSLLPGITMARLHFLCEHHGGIHKVEKQAGYDVHLESETLQTIRPYAVWGLRVLTLLIRVAGHLGAGLGSMTPDLEKMVFNGLSLTSDIPLDTRATTSVPQEEFVNGSMKALTNSEKEAAEQWLVDLIKSLDPTRGESVAQLFGLYRVVYIEQREQTRNIAWVCKVHKDEGLNSGVMKLCPTA